MKTYRANTKKKDVLFIIGFWNAKVGSPEISGVPGKFGFRVQNEAGQRLIDFCEENTLVIADTCFQQHERRKYTWTSPDGQHRNQIDYVLCSWRWRSAIPSAKTRLGADCGSDQFSLVQSVTQSCLTPCNPMNHSTPGLPVHHQLPEFMNSLLPNSNLNWRK